MAWDDKGACRLPGEIINPIFFSEAAEDKWKAKRICAECPVFEQCTEYTLSHYNELLFGIFAGLDENERRAIASGYREWKDWREEWTFDLYVARIQRERSRRKTKEGTSHRKLPVEQRPRCPNCGSQESVNRAGRTPTGRQKFVCLRCTKRKNFMSEEWERANATVS